MLAALTFVLGTYFGLLLGGLCYAARRADDATEQYVARTAAPTRDANGRIVL